MSNTAALWIRDGVLVDRMHINPAAFAFAVWSFSKPEVRSITSLERLINFGFEKSGFSCADKMRLYIERENIPLDVQSAARYYNRITSEIGAAASCFIGANELLRDLKNAGVQNFITSAVEQEVLDSWSHSQQGQLIVPYLTEILGKRDNFSKGRDHFEYVAKKIGNQKIYYVADATAEIMNGKEYAQQYQIAPVGFGNVINVDRVLEAFRLISTAEIVCGADEIPFPIEKEDIQLDGSKIRLPAENEIKTALCNAGAETVITGAEDTIMQNLRAYFEDCGLLQPSAVQ